MSLDPVAVMNAIDSAAALLDQDSRDLHEAITNLQTAQAIYEQARTTALIELMDQYKEAGERLPAEDLRAALVHRRVEAKVYGDFLSAKARVEAIKASSRARENALSARQSLLSTLREEAKVG